MRDYGVEKKIFYFSSEGKENIPKTVELVIERAVDLNIKNILVFTADGEGAFLLKQKLSDNNIHINVHAVTFPYKQPFTHKNKDGKIIKRIVETSKPEIRKKLRDKQINIIQGPMPFQDIVLPGVKDTKVHTINYTLTLLSAGLRLCVQAVTMAVDCGYIEQGEYVISMSADTAIVARGSLSSWLFHPQDGFEINEIICKPSRFTITHNKDSSIKND